MAPVALVVPEAQGAPEEPRAPGEPGDLGLQMQSPELLELRAPA